MRARQTVGKPVIVLLLAAVALIACASLFLLIRHFRGGSPSAGAPALSRFDRELLSHDERWADGLLAARLEDPRAARSLALEDLRRLSGRASSVWQEVSVLKRAQILLEKAVIGNTDFYRLAHAAQRKLPWASELAALAAYASSSVSRNREALALLSLLDPDEYQALILHIYLKLPVEDRILDWRALHASLDSQAASSHDPVMICRLLAHFCERAGLIESQLDWTINAAWFAFLDGRKNEAPGLLRPALHEAILPQLTQVRRIIGLFHLAALDEEALALCERSPLRSDQLIYAELLWSAGRREAAIALWDDPHFFWHPVAAYNRMRQAPRGTDLALVNSLFDTEALQRLSTADWTSIRILAARLRGEGPSDLRNAAASLRARQDGQADVRLELEALSRMDQGREQAAIAAGHWALVNAHADNELVWERAAWWMARYRMWDELDLLMHHARDQGRDYPSLAMYRALERGRAGDHEAAYENLEIAASGEHAWRALANRALLRKAERSYRAALEDLLLATRLFPASGQTEGAGAREYAGLLLRIAALQDQLGGPTEALRTLQRAQDLDPSSLIIRQALDRARKQKERSTRSAPLTD